MYSNTSMKQIQKGREDQRRFYWYLPSQWECTGTEAERTETKPPTTKILNILKLRLSNACHEVFQFEEPKETKHSSCCSCLPSCTIAGHLANPGAVSQQGKERRNTDSDLSKPLILTPYLCFRRPNSPMPQECLLCEHETQPYLCSNAAHWIIHPHEWKTQWRSC